ncbi:MAG TPA: phytanoyl-CoA dioxygenase family protein [Fimbriimonadaceae bacterium]|nr:phytanoyl-CoA dioxygenase family protein [Fimbriimonadaceae bacterium]
MPSTLSETSVREFFNENGYYIAKGVYSPSEVTELETAFDRIVAQLVASNEQINARWGGPEMEKIGAGTVVLHTHNVQQFSSVWLQALVNVKFLDAAEQILGPDIVLHHSKLFQKPSEKGAPFPMHQDWNYFPTEKDSMIAGIIHVSNATDEMGCLRVYPGSHKLGRVENTSGQFESELLSQYPLENAMPLEAEPGDVVFFHYFTLHGSMPNRSNSVRKTVLVQLYSGQDRVEEGNPHPDERLTLRGWNYFASRESANKAK